MAELISVLQVLHIVAAILMARLSLGLLLALALFTYRAYRSTTPYGWA